MSAAVRLAGLWGPVVAFMVAVLLFPASAGARLQEDVSDKLLHAAAFLVHGLFCLRATHGGLRRPARGATVAAILLAVAFAAFDEWRQTWTPDRDGSVGDWIADTCGVLSSLPCFAVLARRRERRR